jgi:hypothetical protein
VEKTWIPTDQRRTGPTGHTMRACRLLYQKTMVFQIIITTALNA